MTFNTIVKKLWDNPPRYIFEETRRLLLGRSGEPKEFERYIWCLSTGRVGSQTLASLGRLLEEVDGQHEPKPLLYGLSAEAYKREQDTSCSRVLKEALLACRDFSTESPYSTYLESSPQVTFLAKLLKSSFTSSRFIHVVRHPGSVVRSGMRRKWYGGHENDHWRIKPISGEAYREWNKWSMFEKNVWLWAETNRWIESFMVSLPENEGIVLKSEDVFSGSIPELSRFYKMLGIGQPQSRLVESVLGKKLNHQQRGEFPEVGEWDSEQCDILYKHAGELMQRYGYTISGHSDLPI